MFEGFLNRAQNSALTLPENPLTKTLSHECCRGFYLLLGERGFALSEFGVSQLLYPHLLQLCEGDKTKASRISDELARGMQQKIEHPSKALELNVPGALKDGVERGYEIYRFLSSPETFSKHRGLFDYKNECAHVVVWQAFHGMDWDTILRCFVEPNEAFIDSVVEAVERLKRDQKASLDDIIPESQIANAVRKAFATY